LLKLTVLGSGSSGNCSLIETPRVKVLVDAGFSGRQIAARLATLGLALHDIQAIFLTHEHSDHVMGLPVLAGRQGIPVHCNELTRGAISADLAGYTRWQLFETGETIVLEDLEIETFAVPHDAYDPCGFVFHSGARTAGFLTDLGHATHLVVERVRQAEALVLEANHDLAMLRADTKRPWAVKQRILARHGHLSNDAAADVAEEIVTERLRHLLLGHLSGDCNTPELAAEVVAGRLEKIGASHVQVLSTCQDRPVPTLVLE
jgi:phosphoribosyl 1,2-cyclic phosphodiesterase